MQTVETEIVRAHTRLDGVDGRLKKIESKMDKLVWIVAGMTSLAGFVAPFVATWMISK